MADTYPLRTNVPGLPAVSGILINFAGADQNFAVPTTGLYITTAGTLKVDTAKGETITFAVVTGVLPLRITKIYQTGSSGVVGLVLV